MVYFLFIFFIIILQIPNWFQDEKSESTKDNPFPLPEVYLSSQQKNVCLGRHYSIIHECLVWSNAVYQCICFGLYRTKTWWKLNIY